jgi:hypothetical protein
MEMKDIAGRLVKIGKTSITVKDEYNKTRGIVRNITLFLDAPTRVQFQYKKVAKDCGWFDCRNESLWKCMIICDGQLYLLKDTGRLTRWMDLMKKVEWVRETDYPKYEKELQIYNKAEELGIQVIECELL